MMIKTISIQVEDFIQLSKLTKCELIVLSELLKIVSLNNNYKDYIILNSAIRKEMVDKLQIATATLNNVLNSLCKKEFITREDTNMYKLNKYLFKVK